MFCLFVIFIYFPFCFKSGICLLIAPVPVHCFSITYIIKRMHVLKYACTGKESFGGLYFVVQYDLYGVHCSAI